MLHIEPTTEPILPSERRLVVIDEDYKPPDLVDSEWGVELFNAYYRDSFFMVKDLPDLETWLGPLTPSTISSIRRIHYMTRDKDCVDSPYYYYDDAKGEAAGIRVLTAVLRLLYYPRSIPPSET